MNTSFSDRDIKIPDTRGMNVTGLNAITITKSLSAGQIVKIYLENSTNEELRSVLIRSVLPILYSSSKFSEVFLFGSKQFDLFCELATQSTQTDENGNSEAWIYSNILYTTHPDFTPYMIPKKVQGRVSKKSVYDRTKVYCMRFVHKEADREPQKVEDIIIYIPDSERI